MHRVSFVLTLLITCFVFAGTASAQDSDATTVESDALPEDAGNPSVTDSAKEKVGEVTEKAKEKIDELAVKVDASEQAKKVSAGILQPIYSIAEKLSFSSFHWLAFAMMATGVVSFALQLVLAKLVVLSRAGFSLTEILSDALGLAISVIGLVLTTQAAAQNSEFTQSAFAVISATAVGVILGLAFYWWGQTQEVQALRGRQAEAKENARR